ncbi:hypothetical protein KAJ27_06650 [bacterium]|nr:hypothetical protein [bacterium]
MASQNCISGVPAASTRNGGPIRIARSRNSHRIGDSLVEGEVEPVSDNGNTKLARIPRTMWSGSWKRRFSIVPNQ